MPEGVEVSPGALLGLLNHQLYDTTPPEKYATLFLGIYDGHLHRLTYSNGGHLPPILIGKDGAVRRLEAGGTVVGLFDNMSYDEGSVQLHPGEIFVAYLFLYGIARFFLEFIRDDPGRGEVFGGIMSGTQLISICLVIGGGILWYLRPTPKAVPASAAR